MGVGLHFLELTADADQSDKMQEADSGDALRNISLDGIVYTSVFNPCDDRKNWIDMVKAFCAAFQDVEDTTLVLKMTHHSVSSFLGRLHFLFQQMWPFKCRIVALHGYLDDAEYEKLIAATSFYVNAARCEGLCLPLMEFMSCGKPAIAPATHHRADYVEQSSTLLVQSGVEPAIWPHDPRELFRALKYRIDWESLMNAYRHSYEIVKNKPEAYRENGRSRQAEMKDYSALSTEKAIAEIFGCEINFMVIIVHSVESKREALPPISAVSDYSYYFVLKKYRPVLEKFAFVVEIRNPAIEVDVIYRNCKARGEPCLFLSFTPPFMTMMDLACPTISSVFAWEYMTLPTDVEEIPATIGGPYLANTGAPLPIPVLPCGPFSTPWARIIRHGLFPRLYGTIMQNYTGKKIPLPDPMDLI